MSGKEIQPITSGKYDVVDFYGYDPVKKLTIMLLMKNLLWKNTSTPLI